MAHCRPDVLASSPIVMALITEIPFYVWAGVVEELTGVGRYSPTAPIVNFLKS